MVRTVGQTARAPTNRITLQKHRIGPAGSLCTLSPFAPPSCCSSRYIVAACVLSGCARRPPDRLSAATARRASSSRSTRSARIAWESMAACRRRRQIWTVWRGGASRSWTRRRTSPLTAPSHASILTGQYPPHHHAARQRRICAVARDRATLAETASRPWVSHGGVRGVVRAESGHWPGPRGFETYGDRFDTGTASVVTKPAASRSRNCARRRQHGWHRAAARSFSGCTSTILTRPTIRRRRSARGSPASRTRPRLRRAIGPSARCCARSKRSPGTRS